MLTSARTRLATAAIAALAAPAAFAGGYTEPVVPAPVVMPEVQAVTPWTGGYLGARLGAVVGGDDEVGFDTYAGGSVARRDTAVGNLDLTGSTYGVRAGYRWQRGNWVFGPELSYDLSSADARAEESFGPAYIESELNSLLSLKLKTGYLVRPDMMVFGSLGAVRGDFTYSSNIRGVVGPAAPFIGYVTGADESVDYSKSGYTLGLGVERKMSERMSMTAEWNYNHFGRTDILFGDTSAGVVTVASPSHHNLSIGLNFSF